MFFEQKRLLFIYVLLPLPQATHDPHYLQVGKLMVENLNKHARVPCGFAAISDVMTGKHEDQYVKRLLNILLHSWNWALFIQFLEVYLSFVLHCSCFRLINLTWEALKIHEFWWKNNIHHVYWPLKKLSIKHREN